jgi:hypothetical protein
MDPTPDDRDPSDQAIFWDAVWTLDDEWTPAEPLPELLAFL